MTLNPDLCARVEDDVCEGPIDLVGADDESLDDAVDVFYEQHAEWTDTVDGRGLFG